MLKAIFFDVAGTLDRDSRANRTELRAARADSMVSTPMTRRSARPSGGSSMRPPDWPSAPVTTRVELRRLEREWWRRVVDGYLRGVRRVSRLRRLFRRALRFSRRPGELEGRPRSRASAGAAQGARTHARRDFEFRLPRLRNSRGSRPRSLFRLGDDFVGGRMGEARAGDFSRGARPSCDCAGARRCTSATPSTWIWRERRRRESPAVLLDRKAPARCSISGRSARVTALSAVLDAVDQITFS